MGAGVGFGFVGVGVSFGFVELVDVSSLVFVLLVALARRQGFNRASVVAGILDETYALCVCRLTSGVGSGTGSSAQANFV